MGNLETASVSLSQGGKDAQKFMSQMSTHNTGDKLGRSIDKLDLILAKIEKGEGSLGALINDPSIHNQLKALLGGSPRKNNIKSLLRTSIEKDTKD